MAHVFRISPATLVGTALLCGLASPVLGQSHQTGGTYEVDCANIDFFRDQVRESPVDVYAHAQGQQPAEYLLNSLNIERGFGNVDGVLLLYNVDRPIEIGVIPIIDGCALDKTFVGLKREIDQVLAGMVHKGYLEGVDPQ